MEHSFTRSLAHLLAPAPLLIALDGPTGMNYDTGALDPATVPADLTITFHAPKRGHYCYPAADARGDLVVVPIGIEVLDIGRWMMQSDPPQPIPNIQRADDALVRSLLPSRKLDSNKGSHGRVVVAGGCSDYISAPVLSATAAYRVGAGLVALAVPSEVKQAAAQSLHEAIFVPVHVTRSNWVSPPLDAHSARVLKEFLAKVKDGAALLMGPGMGISDKSKRFITKMTEDDGLKSMMLKGLVCDADALNTLAKLPDWPARLPPMTVLTPHVGEMSRLTGLSMAEVQADRIGNALRFARDWGHVVLLKGAYTVIAAPDGRGVVLPFANSAMATAGTGDVLAGCIAGLMAQGVMPFDAAVCGGYLHGMAGEHWREQHGDTGMLASDLTQLLPDVIRDLKSSQ